MYFKTGPMTPFLRTDERVTGKLNLKQGLIALILFLGFVGVTLLAAFGYGWIALIVGVVAVASLLLVLFDPMGVLKCHSQIDPDDLPPGSRE